MLPGANGWRWIPRKMAGSEISRMDVLIVTMRMPRVVLERAIHL